MSDEAQQVVPTDEEVPSTFMTYERTVVQTKRVTHVTPFNIGEIAALVKGVVDYTKGQPVLIVRGDSRWKIECGWQVELIGTKEIGYRLVNANGFNHKGEWRVVE